MCMYVCMYVCMGTTTNVTSLCRVCAIVVALSAFRCQCLRHFSIPDVFHSSSVCVCVCAKGTTDVSIIIYAFSITDVFVSLTHVDQCSLCVPDVVCMYVCLFHMCVCMYGASTNVYFTVSCMCYSVFSIALSAFRICAHKVSPSF